MTKSIPSYFEIHIFVTSLVKILKVCKSLPAPTFFKRKIVVAIFFVYSIININSPFDSLDEAP